jgi:CheY-like chemotaxis protein
MSRTILIIDDNPLVREVVRRMLESRGYVVFAADDGPNGIELMAGQEEIDAAIVDVDMPRMNGVEVCRVLREQALRTGRSLWVCLMTGLTRPGIAAEAAAVGARGVLNKPFTTDELVAYVEREFRAAAA